MEIEFSNTKDNLLTCKKGTFRLHSAYNPQKEAERFVSTLFVSFNPKYILITEPCLSYCAEFLKKRFPEAQLLCVRYTDDFSKTDDLWDKVFFLNQNLSEDIYSFLGEEGISSCLFASWPPSENAFSENHKECWDAIKKSVLKSRNVLATRNFFAKRWTKNAIRFSLNVKKSAYIEKGDFPVLICASGPSLNSSLKKIREIRNRVFLISVSSALLPLVDSGIIPDLCISTDGGWWAKEHLLRPLLQYDIPLVLPAEGAAFVKNLRENTIIPLYYNDGPGDEMLKAFKYPLTTGVRNGTVSGTAALLAKEITSSNIYFCGLDLSPAKGYVHTQPNVLEINDSVYDCRLKTKETRIAPSNFNSPALNIYYSWFEKADFNKRLFRLSCSYKYKNSFSKIRDINFDDFENLEKGREYKNKIKIISHENSFSIKNRKLELNKIICESLWKKNWISNAVPAENIVLERTLGLEKEDEAREKLKAAMNGFAEELFKTINLGEDN